MTITQNASGGTTFTGKDDVALFSVITLKTAIGMYVRSKMIANRRLTPATMLAMAGEVTGKTYKRTQMQQALDDLTKYVDDAKKVRSEAAAPGVH